MVNSHYDAFISYQHNERDSAVAKEIHQSLERFRLPRALRKNGMKGITRIFRDTDELPLTIDLGSEISEALDNSDYLIIICSAAWKESRWCRRELVHFLKTHDKKHVLTVISEGDPMEMIPEVLLWDEEKGEREEGEGEMLPPDREPLSADYRMPFRKARLQELPRLVACMRNCRYDELIRRQQQYRVRRLAAIFTTFFLILAGAISYLVWSRAQIQENYQRTLMEQSRSLAAQSMERLEEGDRISAISLALSALPSEEKERPLVTEAEYAMQRALGLYDFSTKEVCERVFSSWNDIVDMKYSADEKSILAVDKSGGFIQWDIETGELLGNWVIGSDEISSFLPRPMDQALFWSTGLVFLVDYKTEEVVWKRDFPEQHVEVVELSGEPETLLVSAGPQLFLLDPATGETREEVLLLPDLIRQMGVDQVEDQTEREEKTKTLTEWVQSGSLENLRESVDGSAVSALFFKKDSNAYFPVLWERKKGDDPFVLFSPVNWPMAQILSPEHLLVTAFLSQEEVFLPEDIVLSRADNPLHVRAADPTSEEVLWEHTFLWEGSVQNTQLYETWYPVRENGAEEASSSLEEQPFRSGILVCFSNQAVLLDAQTGEVVERRSFSANILPDTFIIPGKYSLLLEDGKRELVSMIDGQTSWASSYPEGLSKRCIPFDEERGGECLILKGGKVYLYRDPEEKLFQAFHGDSFSGSIREGRREEGRFLALTEEPSLLVEVEGEVRSYPLEGGPFRYQLLPVSTGEDEVILLSHDSDQRILSLCAVSLADGSVRTIGSGQGILLPYDTYLFGMTSLIGILGDFVYYFDSPFSETLHSISWKDGTTRDIPVKNHPEECLPGYASRGIIGTGVYYLPAPLLAGMAGPDGDCFLTSLYDPEEGRNLGCLLDPQSGELTVLEKKLNEELAVAVRSSDGSRIAVGGLFHVNLYDSSGAFLEQKEFRGKELRALHYWGSLLMALFSDGTLGCFDAEGGYTELPLFTVQTAAGVTPEAVWQEAGEELIVSLFQEAFAIRREENGIVIAARLGHFLGMQDERIYAWQAEYAGDELMNRLGFLPRLSAEELIRLGQEAAAVPEG